MADTDRELRAALETAQARVAALRRRLAEPIDAARLEEEAAADLAKAKAERSACVEALAQTEAALAQLKPQAARAAEELERLRFPPEPTFGFPFPLAGPVVVLFAAAWWFLDDAVAALPPELQAPTTATLLGGSTLWFGLRAWKWARRRAVWRPQ